MWACITIGGYEEKDMVSELHYNFKLCPALKYYKKSLFYYTSAFKGIGSIYLQDITII